MENGISSSFKNYSFINNLSNKSINKPEEKNNNKNINSDGKSKINPDNKEKRNDKKKNLIKNEELKLSQQELNELRRLQQRDMTVKAHEQAHLAVGGKYVTRAANFEYERGPDYQLYAVGGEVSIDTSEVSNDPEATAQKARTVKAAALAPANPSGQDYAVASKASQMEAEAYKEMQEQKTEKMLNGSNVDVKV